jgi:hypothetical protein
MADERNIVDWVYDLLPGSVQNHLYDRWVGQGTEGINNKVPERTGIIGGSGINWDAQATAGQMIEADFVRWEEAQSEEHSRYGSVKRLRNSDAIRENDGTELTYSIEKSDGGYHYAINEWPTVGPDREGTWSEPFKTAAEAEREANVAMCREYGPGEGNVLQDARETEEDDPNRLEHEQSTAAGTWSGDRGAELERLNRSEQTYGERPLDEPPERGIEDDEEELER